MNLSFFRLGFEGRLELDDLWSALSNVPSEIWQVGISDQGVKQIKRRKEFVEKDPAETEPRTVYVENLPPFATIESLSQLFSAYGKVDYVSLPRYYHLVPSKSIEPICRLRHSPETFA